MNISEAKEYIIVLDKILPSLIRHFQIGNPQKIQGLNITLQQYITLRAISVSEKCTVTELSNLLGVTAGTMSGMLNRLAANHYIRRERDRNDRRILYIRSTPEAQKVIDKIIAEQAKHSKAILENLDDNERRELMKIMDKLYKVISKLENNNKGT